MSGFDANAVYAVAVHEDRALPEEPSAIEKKLFQFLMEYRSGPEFIYRCVMAPSVYLCSKANVHTVIKYVATCC